MRIAEITKLRNKHRDDVLIMKLLAEIEMLVRTNSLLQKNIDTNRNEKTNRVKKYLDGKESAAASLFKKSEAQPFHLEDA